MKIKIKSHPVLRDVKILSFLKFVDDRGSFSRKYCYNYLRSLNFKIKQINYSINNKKGTVRGLHYLSYPSKEKKIITCLSGEVFDVIVDVRKNSTTYKKTISIRLSEDNLLGIYIPSGFAHGFQTLKNKTTLIYFHSDFYDKGLDRGINPLDQELKIKWPLKINSISKKDRNSPIIQNN
jgi:dTDP-4-dehydrorhamnose 3,5-epimerase